MEASGVFSLRLATFQHHRSFWESGVVPALLPSHVRANDGVKTLRLIEASRLTGAFIGVSDSFLRCSEDKAEIWPEGVRSQNTSSVKMGRRDLAIWVAISDAASPSRHLLIVAP